ncbi:family 16 glycosylhydrolase [Gracilimonas sp.]|uniref:glycoside hydrolase family 16 protein n=1 Tax=Gracilimonas sp. TaxID=1974203 RepID=UPI00287161DB|nr:glycoside hydrolase family 16 protein [Gracilimonas sp.]
MKISLRIPLALFMVTLLFVNCDSNNEPEDTYTNIVWQDEFEDEGNPDPEKWSFDIGTGEEIFGQPGWGNNELQYYTDRPENISVEDGMLNITAKSESFDGSNYTSAKILTRDKFESIYGRYEARIMLPWGQGIWPAFWLLGDDSGGTVSWPQIGEIDIMEYRGQQPTIIHGSVHGPGYSAGNAVTDSYQLMNGRFDTDFHVFAIEWEPDVIRYYVDDVLYNEITPGDVSGEWVFNDNSFYIILNVAVGGTFVGPPNSSTRFPQTMKVDYVRVYED